MLFLSNFNLSITSLIPTTITPSVISSPSQQHSYPDVFTVPYLKSFWKIWFWLELFALGFRFLCSPLLFFFTFNKDSLFYLFRVLLISEPTLSTIFFTHSHYSFTSSLPHLLKTYFLHLQPHHIVSGSPLHFQLNFLSHFPLNIITLLYFL